MRRFQLNRWVRIGIAAALAFLMLPLGYLVYVSYQTPDSYVRQVPVWGWVHWGEWDYTVFVKPNTIYGARELGPGLTYYENLVEGIEARFAYNFVTDTTARIEGWYEVWEDLRIEDDKTERRVVIPRVPYVVEGGADYALDFTLPVDRAAYRDRVRQIAEETGTSASRSPEVTFTAHVETTATKGNESARDVMEPTLTVPLNGEAFTITGDRSLNENGVIRRGQTVLRPWVETRRLQSVIALGVVALLPGAFFLATAARPPGEDAATREARRLRRKHRKLIAQASLQGAELPGDYRVLLYSMPDLVRVSGELLKPIVYAGPHDGEGQHVFFILDGDTRYEYRLPGASPRGGYNGSARVLLVTREDM